MKESDIETKVCKYARDHYDALTYKFTSPSRRSVPDRMLVFPDGTVVFIEFKAPGKKATEAQRREHQRLRQRRQIVHVIDSVDDGKAIIDAHVNLWA